MNRTEALTRWIEYFVLRSTLEEIESRPDGLGWSQAEHYELRLGFENHAMSIYYSQGRFAKSEPSVTRILESVAMDLLYLDQEPDLGDFLEELGYLSDGASVKYGIKVYNEIQDQRDRIRVVVGDRGLAALIACAQAEEEM